MNYNPLGWFSKGRIYQAKRKTKSQQQDLSNERLTAMEQQIDEQLRHYEINHEIEKKYFRNAISEVKGMSTYFKTLMRTGKLKPKDTEKVTKYFTNIIEDLDKSVKSSKKGLEGKISIIVFGAGLITLGSLMGITTTTGMSIINNNPISGIPFYSGLAVILGIFLVLFVSMIKENYRKN
ncbi:hypothetical protein J4468_02510 [Candidatus Woesearchaeota archaeon]|nr:hypothetical protein [Candidatus Woesearchaeota archaeon]